MTSARRKPFKDWYEAQMLKLPVIMENERKKGADLDVHLDDTTLSTDPRMLAFGYSFEQMDLLMKPMITDGKEGK
jgi:glutamate synthase (NADPH/NADH)